MNPLGPSPAAIGTGRNIKAVFEANQNNSSKPGAV
jgi:hypothetical protein